MSAFLNERAFDILEGRRSSRNSRALSGSFWGDSKRRSGDATPSLFSEETTTSFEDRTDDEDDIYIATTHEQIVSLDQALELQEVVCEKRVPRIADWAAALPTPPCHRLDFGSNVSRATAKAPPRATPKLTVQASNLGSIVKPTLRLSQAFREDSDDLATPVAEQAQYTSFAFSNLLPNRITGVGRRESRLRVQLGQSPVSANTITPIDDVMQAMSVQSVTPIDDNQMLSPEGTTTVFESESLPNTPADGIAMSYGEAEITEFETDNEEPLSAGDESVVLLGYPAPQPVFAGYREPSPLADEPFVPSKTHAPQPIFARHMDVPPSPFLSRRESRRRQRRAFEPLDQQPYEAEPVEAEPQAYEVEPRGFESQPEPVQILDEPEEPFHPSLPLQPHPSLPLELHPSPPSPESAAPYIDTQPKTFLSRRESRRRQRRGLEAVDYTPYTPVGPPSEQARSLLQPAHIHEPAISLLQAEKPLERSNSQRQPPQDAPVQESMDDNEFEAASVRSVGSGEYAAIKKARKQQKRRICQWLDRLEIPDVGGSGMGYGGGEIATAWC